MKIQKSNSKNKSIIYVASGILAGAVIYFGAAWFFKLPPFTFMQKSYEPGEQVVNMDRTETEKKVTEDLQKNPDTKLDNKQNDTPSSPTVDNSTGKQQVNVLLTNTGIFNNTVSASGMVTNSVEQAGSCVFVFTNGASEITKTSEVLPNPSSTSCKTVSFPSSELAADGVWKVYIRYSSSISEGVSNTKEFTK